MARRSNKKSAYTILITKLIENLNWDFIINSYGPEEHKLKYLVETFFEVDGKTIKTQEFINPTPDMLIEEAISVLTTAIESGYNFFRYGHWTVLQLFDDQVGDSKGTSIEIFFSPTRAIEYSKELNRELKLTPAQKLNLAFKNRKKSPDTFVKSISTAKDVNLLKKLLKETLQLEEYEHCSIINNRIAELEINSKNS